MYSAKDDMIAMEEARVDAIEEAVQREVEAYQDLIDVKKEESLEKADSNKENASWLDELLRAVGIKKD